MALGDELHAYMAEHGLNQRELATVLAQAGVCTRTGRSPSESVVSRWCHNRAWPTRRNERLLRHLVFGED